MENTSVSRRRFLGRTAAVGLGALAHPSFNGRVFGANERVVMAIVGSGGRGRGLMRTFSDNGADWAAACDVYGENLDAGLKASGPNAKGYVDYRKVLERKDIDAIFIASPEHWHHQHLIDTVRAGKDSYCEKPMSWSIEQGADMVHEVRKSNRIVQIGMQRRSSPAIRDCKKIIDDGTIGEINMVRAEWYWNRTLTVKPVMADKLDWERFVGPARKQPFEPVKFRHWRYFWDFSGGNMTDQGTHLMDVVQWFTNTTQPVAAQSYGDVYKLQPAETPDTFCALFQYPKFTCTWTLTYTNSFQNGWGLVFQGQKGTLEMCEQGYRVYNEPWGRDRWDKVQPALEKTPGGLTQATSHIQNFLECVKSRQEPNAPVEIGHQAVRTLHLANIAHHRQTRAALADDGKTVRA